MYQATVNKGLVALFMLFIFFEIISERLITRLFLAFNLKKKK